MRAALLIAVAIVLAVMVAACSSPAPKESSDWKHAEGENAFIADPPKTSRRPISHATVTWFYDMQRCSVSVDLPHRNNVSAFVTVPDEWCEGMR